MIEESQLRRLKALAQEPVRGSMPRTRPWPSSHGKFIDQNIEINTLREGLREALAIIAVYRAADEARREEALEASWRES